MSEQKQRGMQYKKRGNNLTKMRKDGTQLMCEMVSLEKKEGKLFLVKEGKKKSMGYGCRYDFWFGSSKTKGV